MLIPRLRHATLGFSLVELCIVMVIMAILLAIGMPSFRTWIENGKTRAAAESISTGLMLARSEAVSRNVNVNFILDATGNSAWTVKCALAAPPVCPAVIEDRQVNEGSSGNVTVSSPQGKTFTFSNIGRLILPAPPGGDTFVSIDIDNSDLAAGDSRKLRVTVDVGGSTRMCDPNVVAPDSRAC